MSSAKSAKFFSLRNSLAFGVAGIISILIVVYFGHLDYSKFFSFNPPFEDASMLFKYANVFAHGGGISWNFGQNPGITDGATDLGFVAILALFINLGFSVVNSAAIINLIAVFLSGGLLYYFSRRFTSERPVALVSFALIAVSFGPVDRYLKSGFSPSVLGLLYLLMVGVLLNVNLENKRLSSHKFGLAGFLAGVSGWWRPEGFYFSALLVIVVVITIYYFKKPAVAVLTQNWAWLITPYISILGLWVCFRIMYFGHLLPTSAVMKAESGLHLGNFYDSLRFIIVSIAPLLLFSISRMNKILAKHYLFLGLVILVLAASWVPISTTLNWWHRMQWPLIPPLLLVMIYSIEHSSAKGRLNFGKSSLHFALLSVAIFLTQIHIHKNDYVAFPEFIQSVSSALSKIDTTAIRLATTEAGLIPLTITGESLDLYGWNDYAIAASDGKNLMSRLTQFSPNMIIVHGLPPTELVKYSCEKNYFTVKWNLMTEQIGKYASSHELKLYRSTLVSPCDAWSIYLSKSVTNGMRDALSSYKLTGTELVSVK